jgi:hypothetical protein
VQIKSLRGSRSAPKRSQTIGRRHKRS